MATATLASVGRIGIHCFPLTIEVDVSPGLPSFTIVGLADTVVQEAKERIRAAIKNSGATFPLSRITVNLAPSDIKKEGVGFDLPIAIGILEASEQLPPVGQPVYYYGELSLQGEVRRTRGTLSFLRHRPEGALTYIPLDNQDEAALLESTDAIFGVTSLKQVMYHRKGEAEVAAIQPQAQLGTPHHGFDFADIHGQQAAKRALAIAAAGHHNVLMRGSPGAGKTLLSRALPSIMPPLTKKQLLEIIEIHSVAGQLTETLPENFARPFRSPHHSASSVSITGGGNPPRPGEITLAHNGILFLDEFAEFPRMVIESLRQPLEDRVITVARAGVSARFPAHCLLIAAINPCPCGFKEDPKHPCTCTPQQIVLYQKKLSGPILDRIDLHVVVPPVKVTELAQAAPAESSETIRERVTNARNRQNERYQDSDIRTNSELSAKEIKRYCPMDNESQALLEKAVQALNLSARSYHKVIKVARTIADLDDQETILTPHVAEALQYRPVTSGF